MPSRGGRVRVPELEGLWYAVERAAEGVCRGCCCRSVHRAALPDLERGQGAFSLSRQRNGRSREEHGPEPDPRWSPRRCALSRAGVAALKGETGQVREGAEILLPDSLSIRSKVHVET